MSSLPKVVPCSNYGTTRRRRGLTGRCLTTARVVVGARTNKDRRIPLPIRSQDTEELISTPLHAPPPQTKEKEENRRKTGLQQLYCACSFCSVLLFIFERFHWADDEDKDNNGAREHSSFCRACPPANLALHCGRYDFNRASVTPKCARESVVEPAG